MFSKASFVSRAAAVVLALAPVIVSAAPAASGAEPVSRSRRNAKVIRRAIQGNRKAGKRTVNAQSVRIGANLLKTLKTAGPKTFRKLHGDLAMCAQGAKDKRLPQSNAAAAKVVDCNIKCKVSNRLADLIRDLGGKVVSRSERFGAIHAHLPVSALEKLAGDGDVFRIRRVVPPIHNKMNTSEGDVAHRVAEARAAFGVTGSGVKIGVISDSARHLADIQATGDLPANVTVLPGYSGIAEYDIGEGTAMMEIVYDLCPGASLYFATAGGTEEEMAEAILALYNAGCKIIVDDLCFQEEPAFQDGVVAQAANEVVAKGCIYVSCAANKGNVESGCAGVWEGDFKSCGTSFGETITLGGIEYEVHDFGSGGSDPFVYMNYWAVGDEWSWGTELSLQWSDPLGKSSSDYAIALIDFTDGETTFLQLSDTYQTGEAGHDPYEYMEVGYKGDGEYWDADDYGNIGVMILREKGEPNRYVRLGVFDSADEEMGDVLEFVTEGQIYGHNAAESVISVAAADPVIGRAFNYSDTPAYYTSDGPRRMFYRADGTAYTSSLLSDGGKVLEKPDVMGASSVSCATPDFEEFSGTSAAAPHVAAIIGLLLEADPTLTSQRVREILCQTTVTMSDGWRPTLGYGAVDAYKAVQAVKGGDTPPPQPPPSELAFGPGKSSTFEITGVGTAKVGGVANLNWSMFTDAADYFGQKCFVNANVVDAEKTAEKNNDNFWCGALSLMDLAFIQGWAPDSYATVDSMVAEFSKTGANDIRYVSGISVSLFDPKNDDHWYDYFYEGAYGYEADENFIDADDWLHYVGMFRWLKEKKSVSKIMEAVSTGLIGSDFGTVLKNALPTKLLKLDVWFDSRNTHPYWGGYATDHSVVCCGCVCDGSDKLKALFIIDPDNSQYTNGGGTAAPNSIIYCPVTWDSYSEEWTIEGIWGESGTLEPGYVALATQASVPNKVETPVLDPATNMVFTTESLTVKCTCETAGAEIHFTTNGDAVAKSSEKWPDGGLVITDTTTVKVRAYKDGQTESDEVSVTYTYSDPGGTGKRALDPVVAVGRKDRTDAAAAATYTGWLYDASGNLTGSFTMKIGKASKTGFAKVTLTVTDLATGQKTKYKGDYDVSDGKITGGDLEDLAIGVNGVVGTVGSGKTKSTLTGARNAPKEADQAKVFDTAFKGKVFTFAFTGKSKSISGSAAFTVKFSAKGKAKVSGTLMDGSKVSTSAQLVLGDGKVCALPIAFSKKNKANFGLVLWFSEKAAFKEATSIKTCRLSDGTTSVSVTFEDCDAVDGAVPRLKQLLVSEKKVAALEVSGKKIVATSDDAAAKPKLSYAVKTGLFTGSYKATVKGVAKPVTAKITGAWLGNHGVGTASAKVNKVLTTWPVEVK